MRRSVLNFVSDVLRPKQATTHHPACPKCGKPLNKLFDLDDYLYYRCACGSASVWTPDGRLVAGDIETSTYDS